MSNGIRKVSTKLRKLSKTLPKVLADAATEAVPLIVAELKSEYPSEHIRTGRAKDSIEGRLAGAVLRFRAGVRKRKSKSGKRRKSRTGKVNYAQFLPWMLTDLRGTGLASTGSTVRAILDKVVRRRLDAL